MLPDIPGKQTGRARIKVKNGHPSKFSNLSNRKEEAWKNRQGFNGIRTRDLLDTGAMLYQLSYEATHWDEVNLLSSYLPWGVINDVKYIWNNSYLNCGQEPIGLMLRDRTG